MQFASTQWMISFDTFFSILAGAGFFLNAHYLYKIGRSRSLKKYRVLILIFAVFCFAQGLFDLSGPVLLESNLIAQSPLNWKSLQIQVLISLAAAAFLLSKVSRYPSHFIDLSNQAQLNQKLEALVLEKTRALTQSESRMRIIADSLPVSILYWNEDGRLRFANSTYQRWRNSSADALYGQHISDIVGAVTYEKCFSMFEASRMGQTTSYEIEVEYPDRKRLISVTNIADMDQQNQKTRGVISVISDLTGHRTVETLLRNAKEAADAANMAKSTFLANMSHEIRTPLGAIIGFADLLAEPDISQPEQNHYLAAIRRNGDLLTRIINDILDLSKVEANRMDIEYTEVSIQEVITDVKNLLRLMAEEKGLGFKIDLNSNLPSAIITDPLRIRQILLNIVGNAIKFTHAGSIELRVSKKESEDSNSPQIEFNVRDTGIGISADQKGKLFQPFSQADVSTKRRFGGTGLGLVLSQRLAEQLGGDVSLVKSEPNVGSEFVISIADRSDLTKVSKSSNNSHLQRNGAGMMAHEERVRGLRILLVEDSPDIQFLVCRFLKNAGSIVETADNGADALTMAHKKHYDLMLMDLQMPVMDGYETVERLRQEGFRLPIIALTAHAMLEERQKCLHSGFTDHLGKPIDRKQLIDCISQNYQAYHWSTKDTLLAESSLGRATPRFNNDISTVHPSPH